MTTTFLHRQRAATCRDASFSYRIQFTSSEFRSQEANKIQMIHTGQMRDPELDEAPETHGERLAHTVSSVQADCAWAACTGTVQLPGGRLPS